MTISLRDIPGALKVLREEWERQSKMPEYTRSWHGKARLKVARELMCLCGHIQRQGYEWLPSNERDLTHAADLLGIEVQP
jgi:hypothetical protein